MALGYLLSPTIQIQDVNGIPLTDGKIYVYYANTSNLAETYSNYEGTLNTNPIVLDTLGHTTVIAENTYTYDIAIKDKNDNLLFSVEDVAVGSEGGIAPTGNVVVRAGNNGITVTTSIENDITVYTVSIDYNFVASKTDLNSKQDVLSAGSNISIDNNTISVTGLKTINVSEPLQKTDTVSSWNLSIDTDGFQTTLSAGTNIDSAKLTSGYIDLKNDGCYASINSIAIGNVTTASDSYSFAEGVSSLASGYGSHSEGYSTSSLGGASHAEGAATQSTGDFSHAEGNSTSSLGTYSHAEGVNTITSGDGSHAEGNGTTALGNWSHAEGDHCIATGWHSHAEGSNTSAYGSCSHTIGSNTIAYGTNSLAGGFNTIASGADQTVFGRYNIPNETDLFQIGAGTPGNNNKNALTVDNNGDVNVNTTTGLKNTRVFFDNVGETTYYYTKLVPINPCSGTDFIPLTNGGDTGVYGICSQSFNVPTGKKVKVDGFYQIKGGIDANGGVSNWAADPICETWIIDDSTGTATEINQAVITNGGNLPRSVPIPFSFVTGGDFKLGFCSEGTWGTANFTNRLGQTNPTAGNVFISYTTTIIDKE